MKIRILRLLIGLFSLILSGIMSIAHAQIVVNFTLQHTTCNLCNGAVTNTSFAGGMPPYSVTWSQNPINMLCAGNYAVTVTDAAGQTATQTFTINGSAEQAIELTLPPPPHLITDCFSFCAMFATYIEAPPGYSSYAWSGPGITGQVNERELIVSAPGGTYCVTVTNGYGCIGSACTTVFDIYYCYPPNNCGNQCMGSAEVISLTGGAPPYSYTWSNGATNTVAIDNLCTGNYQLTITDANNTKAELSFYVSDAQFIAYLLPQFGAYCPDNSLSIPINLSGYTNCLWSDGLESCNRVITQFGSYGVTVTDAQDCRYWGNMLVSPSTALNSVNIGGGLNLTAASPCTPLTAYYATSGTSYQWSSGETANSIQVCSPGTYCVTATSATYNCTSSNCVTVTLNGIVSAQPQSITPKEVTVWYNPAAQTLHILPQVPDTHLPAALFTIYDLSGKIVMAAQLPTHNATTIDALQWQTGIYLWQMQLPTGTIWGKVWVN